MYSVDKYRRVEKMISGFDYDPQTLSSEVMELLKVELPQPIYEEIEEINIPRPPDVVSIAVGYYQPRRSLWYN